MARRRNNGKKTEPAVHKAINSHATMLEALLVDVTAIHTAIDDLVTKLNADAGVTDTDYAAAAALTAVTGADTVV